MGLNGLLVSLLELEAAAPAPAPRPAWSAVDPDSGPKRGRFLRLSTVASHGQERERRSREELKCVAQRRAPRP